MEFGSTSSLDTRGSSSAIHRPIRGRSGARLSDELMEDLSVASGTSRLSGLAARDVGRNAVVNSRGVAISDDEDEEEEEQHYDQHGGAQIFGESDADSEESPRKRRYRAEHVQPSPPKRLLLPTTELELPHAKKKRTRVLPTAHQSAELNKLLAETPFLSTRRREELGRRIGLSSRKVRVWFQNRRQKARREKEKAAMKLSAFTPTPDRPESPSFPPHSPRHGHGHPMRMSAIHYPLGAWNPPVAPGAGAGYPPRTEYTVLKPATTHFGHLTPGSSPYQLQPVDIAPEAIAEYGTVPVYRRHSPRAQSWSGGDPQDPMLEPVPQLSFNREHQRSSAHAEAERFTPVEHPVDQIDTLSGPVEGFLAVDDIVLEGSEPHDVTGHFSDLFIGTYKGNVKVAMKRLRIDKRSSHGQEVEKLEREATIWLLLKHPYILHFIGIYRANDHTYLVSPFAENGNLACYIRQYPERERISFLLETADAIAYLHAKGVVHGDIKARNILVSDSLHAQLCDFGLAKHAFSITASASKGQGSSRWQSPEILYGESRTFASDTYAFGITVSEVLSGAVPFPHLKVEHAVIYAVMSRDERPVRLPTQSQMGEPYERLWNIAVQCWDRDPQRRPRMSDVHNQLWDDYQQPQQTPPRPLEAESAEAEEPWF